MAAYALMIAVTSTIASGTVFNSLLDVSTTVAILIAGGVVVLYCVTGGMWSLTLTDIIQFGIMTVGIFGLLLPFAISEAGGLSGDAGHAAGELLRADRDRLEHDLHVLPAVLLRPDDRPGHLAADLHRARREGHPHAARSSPACTASSTASRAR